jgi:hemerythrin-like domain-containing protein
MSRIIDALRNEHVGIANVLGVLEREVAAFALLRDGDPADFALMTAALDYFGDFPDKLHHPKEDMVFTRLRQQAPEVARDLGDLIETHTDLALRLRDFADALRQVMYEAVMPRASFVKRARAFIEHQRLHLRMEEAHFFPAAERVLGPADWAELESRMEGRLDPLIGGPSSERYEALRRSILEWEAAQRPTPKV